MGKSVMSRRRGAIFIAIVCFVLGLVLVAAMAISSKGAITTGFVDPGTTRARAMKRVCNATPPDYPGCSVEQVESIAQSNSDDWFEHKRFGVTANNVLNKTDLTANQKDRVMDVFADDIRERLVQMRAAATKRGVSKRTWTTSWRGDVYTVDSFPYKRFSNSTFAGDDVSDGDSCFFDIRARAGYAYNWCTGQTIPAAFSPFWEGYIDETNDPGPSTTIPCSKEVVIGLSGGAATGAVASIWTGPGVAAGAGIGGVSTGTGALVGCAVGHLGDLLGWWKYPKWEKASPAERQAMFHTGMAGTITAEQHTNGRS
jgi:hypothetical protein